jgi:hypothetical protein
MGLPAALTRDFHGGLGGARYRRSSTSTAVWARVLLAGNGGVPEISYVRGGRVGCATFLREVDASAGGEDHRVGLEPLSGL